MQTSLTAPQIDDMEAMKIKFGGGDQIDANTLINSLIHFTNIVQEVNKDLSRELNVDKRIELKIKAHEPGSFLVDMTVIATSVGGLFSQMFSKEIISYSANLIQTVAGTYNFAKLLKGNKPKSISQDGDTITVETTNGVVNKYDFRGADFRGANIYFGNPVIQKAMSKEFETLDADPSVENFGLLDNKNTVIAEIERIEFSDIAEMQLDDIVTDENTRIHTIYAVLQIKTQDWTFKKAWDFYLNGHVIKAKIKDNTFIQKVLGREEGFYAGDSLDVVLDISQKLDEPTKVWVNKSYSVKEIKLHHKGLSQKGLF
jgi:hypothetical protein